MLFCAPSLESWKTFRKYLYIYIYIYICIDFFEVLYVIYWINQSLLCNAKWGKLTFHSIPSAIEHWKWETQWVHNFFYKFSLGNVIVKILYMQLSKECIKWYEYFLQITSDKVMKSHLQLARVKINTLSISYKIEFETFRFYNI